MTLRAWPGPHPPLSVAWRPNRASPQWAGLVGWWPMMDPTGALVRDALAGRNGAQSGVTVTPVATPVRGAALSYPGGTVGGVAVPHAAAFNITAAITLSAWVKLSGQGYITTKLENSWFFQVGVVTGGKVGVYLIGVSAAWLEGTTSVNDGAWHLATATWDGATIAVYVDGNRDATVSRSGTIGTGTAALQWGSRGASGVAGVIALSDGRIYNRALSAAEVFALWNPATRWQLYGVPVARRGTVSGLIWPGVGPGVIGGGIAVGRVA